MLEYTKSIHTYTHIYICNNNMKIIHSNVYMYIYIYVPVNVAAAVDVVTAASVVVATVDVVVCALHGDVFTPAKQYWLVGHSEFPIQRVPQVESAVGQSTPHLIVWSICKCINHLYVFQFQLNTCINECI